MTNTIRVSVVVPTFKRPELLKQCLAALMKQDFDPAAYEIVVADDAASDETRRLIEYGLCAKSWVKAAEENLDILSIPLPCSPAPLLRYIPVTQGHGPAGARNAGWRIASGEIIAFTDDDCIPAPSWLSAGVAAFENEVVGVQGRVIVPIPDTPTDYELNAAGLERGEFVTANCFYRRDAIAAVGGFDERFTAAWREDSDLFFTFLERGSKLVHAPNAIVVHPVRPASWGVSLSQQRKSMFNALLYKKHPKLYRERLQPVTPWHYYCILGAMLTAISCTLNDDQWLAIAAVGVWLFMTSRFCMQRLKRTSHTLTHVAEMVVTSALIPPLSVFWRILGAFKFRVLFF